MADALTRLGHAVEPFEWYRYFGSSGRFPPVTVWRRAQNKYLFGPHIGTINADLIERAVALRPDLLFVYRGTHIRKETLSTIRARAPGIRIVGYNNDDPFAATQPMWPWRHFKAAIPEYDCILAYRPANLDDFATAGARSTALLLPWFVPAVHRPMNLGPDEQCHYGSEVVFIGHYESDGRLAALEALASAGVDVRLFGPGAGYPAHDWHGPLSASDALRRLIPIREVWGDEYARALSASRIALCFLSKRNRDRYTRRCFEIPATGTLLLSEFTPELAALFTEGVDAEFFRSHGELVEKARYYLQNVNARDAVARRGYDRVYRDGHDVDSRMRQMLEHAA
jgi:spore maturation protein CgeB